MIEFIHCYNQISIASTLLKFLQSNLSYYNQISVATTKYKLVQSNFSYNNQISIVTTKFQPLYFILKYLLLRY